MRISHCLDNRQDTRFPCFHETGCLGMTRIENEAQMFTSKID